MSKIFKIVLFVFMLVTLFAGITFPIVNNPSAWYEFPFIPGLGELAKIIFFHVPTAWLASVAFISAMFYGIQYLRTSDLDYDAKALSSLQLGMVFAILATVTGSVWAKFNWGSFWNWDPRETSFFILLLIYGSLFALRSALDNEEKRARLSAVYSIFAALTVPFFVFIMPRIMSGLHPGSADDTNAGPIVDFKMNGNMLSVFFFSLFTFTLLYIWLWKLNYKSIILKEKLIERKEIS